MKKFSTLMTVFLFAETSFFLGISTALALKTLALSSHLEYQISQNFDLLNLEGFGELKIGLTAAEVTQILGEVGSKGEQKFWGADGLYHQNWNYPRQGITLNMAAETEEGSAVVSSIRVQAPSQLQTKRGVGIGDYSAKVKQVYAPEEDAAAPISSDYFVAGSVYGGLIFEFQNNQVKEIFLGAVAE
ncbi:hypothetical protein M595_0653 [Lyngbya aestuarii BL J]|uniref:Uncharacterized protein n=1 Tax=Lyngbya aestuarii BL J TaxID=1348334 RepID=U7QSG4_9CYAN|nr:hypothetical protein [Lyngbya aestuarii]ERT09361.1 hypothetical protein M595_0653 [Lyngbya aestuarii BL J]